ncbi:MAG: pirin family protein [Siculibacillus sp.]
MTIKTITTQLAPPPPHWVGDGFLVRPLFGALAFTAEISPFLMFDHAAPRRFPPSSEPRGVGPHPHRGIETVTIVYDGEVAHRDSAGHVGTIGPGDVQWMTAASGVVHEEFHGGRIAAEGGVVSMAQLWVNLPGRDKAGPAAYQAITDAAIPRIARDGRVVRVIAGTHDDGAAVVGPAETRTPLTILDVALDAGARFSTAIAAGWTTIVAVTAGAARVGDRRVDAGGVVLFDRREGRIEASAEEGATRFLVLAGEPIDEPIAHLGPFVMNTREELVAAFEDHRAGRMGRL